MLIFLPEHTVCPLCMSTVGLTSAWGAVVPEPGGCLSFVAVEGIEHI